MAFENIVGKGENAGNHSPFPMMFSSLSEEEIIFKATFILSAENVFNLGLSKILPFGKGLSLQHGFTRTSCPFMAIFFAKLS